MMLESPLEGNQITVEVEEMNGGNYTCHLGPGGEYLNHTTILVQLDPDNRTVILEEKSPSDGKLERDIRCKKTKERKLVLLSKETTENGSKGLTVLLFLQVTSTARHPTIKAPSTAPGQEKCPDLMLLCSWLRHNGEDKNIFPVFYIPCHSFD